MFLNKFLNTEKPKYINEKTNKEISEKGFSVYNYISLKELLLTTRKDFLDILSKINIVFAILTLIFWFIVYSSWNIIPLLWFLWVVYSLIFIFIFLKLIIKTYSFFMISEVVYSKGWLILWDKFYKYNDKKLDKILDEYADIFEEYLSMPSKLEDVIQKNKNKLLSETSEKGFSLLWKLGSRSSRNSAWLVLVWAWVMILYIGSLYLFYYLAYFFGFIFAIFYSFFIKILLSFKKNTELKIRDKTLNIDKKLNLMHNIYNALKSKIEEFKSGEISNIWDFVENKFSDFYVQIELIIKEKKQLEQLINNSKYKQFIDFEIFKKYLRNHFNKPILDMIWLLKKFVKLLKKQVIELDKVAIKSGSNKLDINNTEILDSNLWNKEIILNNKIEILERNILGLEKKLLSLD